MKFEDFKQKVDDIVLEYEEYKQGIEETEAKISAIKETFDEDDLTIEATKEQSELLNEVNTLELHKNRLQEKLNKKLTKDSASDSEKLRKLATQFANEKRYEAIQEAEKAIYQPLNELFLEAKELADHKRATYPNVKREMERFTPFLNMDSFTGKFYDMTMNDTSRLKEFKPVSKMLELAEKRKQTGMFKNLY